MAISQELLKFIREIGGLKAVGCIRCPRAKLEELREILAQSDLLVSEKPRKGTLHLVYQEPGEWRPYTRPAILVTVSEDWDKQPFADRIKREAEYFLNVA